MFIIRPTDRLVFIGNPAMTVTTTKKQTALANWWEAGGAAGAIAAYRAIGAASHAASKVNLVNAGTHPLTDGDAPTFSAVDGWTFNGSSDYLITDIIPAEGNFAIVRFSDAVGATIVFGARGNPRFYFWAGDGENGNYGEGTMGGTPSSFSGGVFGTGDNVAYYNGAALTGLNSVTWVGTLAYPMAIGCMARDGGVFNTFFTGKIQAFAIYATAPSAGQVAAISTAMAAL